MIESLQGRRLLVIGDVMLDRFVYGRADRVSPEAPALVLQIESDRWVLGGAANVAANIAALGGRAILVGRVGADDDAATIARLAGEHGDRISLALTSDPSAPTTVKTRYLAGDRHLLRADREQIGLSASSEAEIIQTLREAMDAADAVVISDYAKGVVSDAVLAAVFDAAARQGKPVVVDPKRRALSAYRGATVLTPNRRELAFATGLDCDDDASAEQAAATVMAETGAVILLTRSEQGISLHRSGHETWRDKARARRVRDVSGAGDTVTATVALGLAAGLDLTEAAHLANVAAGVVVGKSGTSLVTSAELHAALAAPDPDREASPSKRLTLENAVALRERWREEGVRVGFTNGCFDLIHPGHIQILRQAAQHCDKLIVALNSDASVRRLKGPSRPVQNQDARAEVMAALEPADMVLIFGEDTPLNLIRAIEPDVLVKGADYREDQVVGADIVKSYGGKVVLVELVPDQSTSGLIERSANPIEAA
ncbi:MAG TPA: D-glycero-beta-D-manno-heptose 1-phosphate adenylyltransferase [Caulobacteraceae bacterium]